MQKKICKYRGTVFLQISMSAPQTMEDVASTPAAATCRVASNVAVTQDTTEMESPALVGYR